MRRYIKAGSRMFIGVLAGRGRTRLSCHQAPAHQDKENNPEGHRQTPDKGAMTLRYACCRRQYTERVREVLGVSERRACKAPGNHDAPCLPKLS